MSKTKFITHSNIAKTDTELVEIKSKVNIYIYEQVLLTFSVYNWYYFNIKLFHLKNS